MEETMTTFSKKPLALWTGVIAFVAAVTLPGSASAFCFFNCNYTQTKHPIVLAHGLAGFDSLVGGLDYWYGVVDSLEDGGAEVYVTEVPAFNSSAVRGESLIVQLDELRAIKGKPNLKFNLIGHSQGGVDIRYVAGVRPDLVASLTTIGSPHLGSDLFEFNQNPDDDILPPAIASAVNTLIDIFWTALGGSNEPNDLEAVLDFAAPPNVAAYNAAFPNGIPDEYCSEGAYVTYSPNGPIRNYSWTGISPLTHAFDPSDAAFLAVSLFYDEPNDGLVEQCAAHFGKVLRNNYLMNHFDEVNQIYGLTSPFDSDPRSVIRAHANRLKKAGL